MKFSLKMLYPVQTSRGRYASDNISCNNENVLPVHVLLPFILQFRASGKDPIFVKAKTCCSSGHVMGSKYFTGDLVLCLLIGRHLTFFFPKKLLMGFTVRKISCNGIQIVC